MKQSIFWLAVLSLPWLAQAAAPGKQEEAEYQGHWSFVTPERPPVPQIRNPQSPIRNPIDAFILDQVARASLKPSLEADKETLIRRVTFDLTGLPPTIAEVDAFLADTAPDAYERVVNRLLHSPRYGEHLAHYWLDAARYGDTHGLQFDNERSMWPYRDWVVRAFNENLPFDKFTIWQVAGDLLPSATRDQQIASGFNRCNVTTNEGGSIDEEYLFHYAVDRTETTATVWMGLTVGCAVCHDHKFDPITAKEFYSLYAFFASAADPAMDGNLIKTPPILKLSTPQQDEELAEFDAKISVQQQRLKDELAKITYEDPATLDPAFSLAAWEKANNGKAPKGYPKEIGDIFKNVAPEERQPEQKELLRSYYLENVCQTDKAVFDPIRGVLKSLQNKRNSLDDAIPTTFIMQDLDKPREAFVMQGGQYNKPGQRVFPNVPAVFPPLKAGEFVNRLDLAEWLVHPQHPLTARVAVNRFWQQFFGRGLVTSSNDFGSQGQPPSHPELLDWLAVGFVEQGWDVKKFMKLLVTSATYRQSSQMTPNVLQVDPENRLYARGPRFRLDAEVLRDNALFVSGLMDNKLGGKGVKPYQPENIWEPLGYEQSNTRDYKQDAGPALYRRSLYTFIKRTAPAPSMSTFDAPSRERVCVSRDRSNTPLQALLLMNDVQHIEAARAFAQRMLAEGGATTSQRLAWGFRTATSRLPSAEEMTVLAESFQLQLRRYQADPEAAGRAISYGESKPDARSNPSELAAYTLVANMILNLDEVVTKN